MTNYTFKDTTVAQYIRHLLHKSIIEDITVEELATIETVEICGDMIGSLEDFVAFPHLRILDLSNSMLMCDTEPLRQISSLRSLFLFGTGFEDIESLLGLPITSLGLGRCYSTDLLLLSRMKQLKLLELNDNNLGDICFLSELTSLEVLNLSDNNITDISPLTGMVNMNVLNLSNNNICDLGPLAAMSKLRVLDIHSNLVSSVDPIKCLKNLSSISSYDNPADPWQVDYPA